MNIDRDIVTRAVNMQRRGIPVDAILNRATRHHGRTFDRLRHYKAYADAICREIADPQDVEDVPPCPCGYFAASWHGLRIHHGKCDQGPDIDPRAGDAVSRYASGEPVMDIVRDFGISTATLYNWLTAYGQKKRQPQDRRSA